MYSGSSWSDEDLGAGKRSEEEKSFEKQKQRLEAEVRIHSILNGTSEPRIPLSESYIPLQNIVNQNDNQSVVSHLTDSEISRTPSTVGRVASSFYGISSQAFSMMMGKGIQEEESEYTITIKDQVREDQLEEPTPIIRSPPKIDFLLDDLSEMTWGRRIALANMHQKWYYQRPTISTEELRAAMVSETRPAKITCKKLPSLEKAWAYFEHFALSRFLVDDDGKYDKLDLKRAEPGECELLTKMYHPIFTPQSQMGDFGLGVGLYFSTLSSLIVLMIVAGLINLPNILYFAGPNYSGGQETLTGFAGGVKGSAICTETEWVLCPDCGQEGFAPYRFAEANTTNGVLKFALRNTCDGPTPSQGMVNYGTLLFLIVGIIILNLYLIKQEIRFDEDEQTAQDYSIQITNPENDARDPEEWRKFFKEVFDAHATVITIALDNDPLIRALRERRECMHRIEINLEPGTSLDQITLSRIAAEVEFSRKCFGKMLAFLTPGIPELFGRIAELEAKIRGWAQLDYPCSNVFVTFETEKEQRTVLEALSVGSYHVRRQNKEKVQKEHLFRKKIMLNVEEPDEPNTIRWADLNLKLKDILKTLATTTAFSFVIIVLIALLIKEINDWNAAYAAIAIALFNSGFPEIAKLLTKFESHASESGVQTSLYFKIATFRWITTAIIVSIVTPFTNTLDEDGLINSVFLILVAEIATTNVIQLCDFAGQFKRHVLAPRAITQDAMNLNMQGSEISLAERYTNMTKILFLAMWYSSIYPAGFFMCAFALFVNYFTDRFSIMRSWKKFPHLGTGISAFSRRYFFTTALVLMSIISAYFWSGFPFDNLCENNSSEFDPADEEILLIDLNKKEIPIQMSNETKSFRYCNQDLLANMRHFRSGSFPALSIWQTEGSEWMSDDQEQLVDTYGLTSVVCLCLGIAFFAYLSLTFFRKMFSSDYKQRGDDQGIRFSKVQSISAYIPQVSSTIFSFPLLACPVDNLDPELYDWTDPDRPHSYYDLTKDADELIGDQASNRDKNFSIISHVPCPR